MELLISKDEAVLINEDHYWTLLYEAEKKLKRSRAKNKAKSVGDLTWFISHCLEITGEHTLAEIFEGTRARDEAEKSRRPTKEKVDDIVSRTHASLGAKCIGAHVTIELEEIPQVLRDDIHNGVLKEEAEQARVDAMTPEEREQDIQELLGQLRGPGFIEL